VALRDSQWVIFEREPAMLAFVSSAGTLDLELGLPGASVANTGHALFHTATHVGLACASCHPEAGDDGHVWNFDIGARRTQTLHGGLSGTAPFHWSGDEASMDNLVFDVMAGRMGGNQQTPERTAALLGWLDTQPVLEAPPTDPAAVARGAALFSSATCATCHTGALGTNNVTVDVGTGGMFQVPRLVELGWRNQWFHDGRIATASDRFAPSAGGDQHGVVSTLSAQDKADLIEYLRSR
jgi:mono/diheme cytochrome c family protein